MPPSAVSMGTQKATLYARCGNLYVDEQCTPSCTSPIYDINLLCNQPIPNQYPFNLNFNKFPLFLWSGELTLFSIRRVFLYVQLYEPHNKCNLPLLFHSWSTVREKSEMFFNINQCFKNRLLHSSNCRLPTMWMKTHIVMQDKCKFFKWMYSKAHSSILFCDLFSNTFLTIYRRE